MIVANFLTHLILTQRSLKEISCLPMMLAKILKKVAKILN